MTELLAFFSALYKNRYVISAVGVVFLVLSFYTYHLYASARIDSLQRDNQDLSRKIEQQQREIDNLKVNYVNIIQAKDELSKEVDALKNQQRTEEEKIYRENRKKKSLEELAIKKTTLVQKVVNKATKKVFDCFVTLSEGGDC
jgi:hypothetical protein